MFRDISFLRFVLVLHRHRKLFMFQVTVYRPLVLESGKRHDSTWLCFLVICGYLFGLNAYPSASWESLDLHLVVYLAGYCAGYEKFSLAACVSSSGPIWRFRRGSRYGF